MHRWAATRARLVNPRARTGIPVRDRMQETPPVRERRVPVHAYLDGVSVIFIHGDSVDLSFPVRQHSHAGCLVALGPVLRRRRTYDRCFERCAPAVPQHDRPRASTIPLPAHSPCTAASEQSPAAIDPCGDVGCLAGFRQEGSPPYLPCMRYSIKRGTRNWNSLTRYMIRADLDCVFGKS